MQTEHSSVARKWCKWFRTLVILPARLLLKNASVIFIILVVIIFNILTSVHENLHLSLTGSWAFGTLPHQAVRLFLSPALTVAAVAVFFAKTFLDVLVSQQMMLIFKDQHKTLMKAVTTLKWASFSWFVGMEFLIYLCFGLIAAVFYVPALFVWNTWRVDLVVMLVIIGVLMYPALYGLVATAAMVSVFPSTAQQKLRAFSLVLRPRALAAIYGYYSVRVFVEVALLAAAPLLALGVFHNKFVASAAIALGLLAPFVLLRGASYALSLQLMAPDENVKGLFRNYFNSNEGEARQPVEENA